jgi:3-phenylpropionate/trans-cinnamate dioxygenase ferredoxin subunit
MEVTLGPADLADGELRGYELGEERYVLVARLGDGLYALDDLCNHAGCLLSGGFLEQQAVVCPCHEYKFDVSSGRNLTWPRRCEDQKVFPLRVVDGALRVQLPDGKR